MQAIKDKLHDMEEMRKAKAEAKEEENAEKELARTRVEIAHELRLAREAEAAMDLHVNKAADIAAQHEAKHPQSRKTENKSNSPTAVGASARAALQGCSEHRTHAGNPPSQMN